MTKDSERVTTYCNVCNAVTVTPTCALCAACLHYLKEAIEREDPTLLQLLYYDPDGVYARTSKDAPVAPRLARVLDSVVGGDLRMAVTLARRQDAVENEPRKRAQWQSIKWSKPKPLCDN